jgi:predicted hydrolase (HD superfamily)
MALPTRDQAQQILTEHVKDAYQVLHAQMIANAMEFYGNKFGEDKDLWFITGLLHDVDYFEFPDTHPDKSLEWFKEWGYPVELIDAVNAHGLKQPRLEPKTRLAKALIAIDELAGLIYAYSLMRPTGFEGMEAKSILKKFKDHNFAAKISREEVQYGVDLFGVDFAELVQDMIGVFQKMGVTKV